MVRDVGERHAKVVETIGHTMGEAAHNEQRDTKNQGQHLVLTGKSDSRGHDEPTADAQHATPQSTHGQTAFQDALGGFLQRQGLQRAIRYVRAHAADYRILPENIALVGFSAAGIVNGAMPIAYSVLFQSKVPSVASPAASMASRLVRALL